MVRVVNSFGHGREVRTVVVERVMVYMVDVMTRRDGAMFGFPDFLVKSAKALTLVGYSRRVVHAVTAPLRFWVTPKLDAVEHDHF